MGKKSGPSAPPAPDPVAVSKAQTESNIETAREQQRLNMVGASGPEGTVNYVADPTQPGGYRQVTTLSPEQQAIWNAQQATELGATQIAQDQLSRVRGALETPLDTSGLPPLYYGKNFGEEVNRLHVGPLQTTFDPGGQLQTDIGGDLNAARQQAIDAVYGQATSRLDPRFEREENTLRTNLANQGFSQNSSAYKDALDDFGRTKTDAYNQAQYSAIGAGEDAAQALFGRQAAQGTFRNQAVGQQYAQNQGLAAFANDAEAQRFGQDRDAAALQFQARQAAAVQNNTARQQALQERAYIQNQPINQLTGLLSLGQVGMPQGIQYTPTQVANTDVLGAHALKTQADNARYQAQQQKSSGLMNGLFSLGSAAILASDRRLKKDVRKVGRRRGFDRYAYRYVWDAPDAPLRYGVMAQDVLAKKPGAVVRMPSGYLAVDYVALEAA